MQLLLAIIVLLFLWLDLTAATHDQCWWRGPGTGTGSPKDDGFSVFGVAKQRDFIQPGRPLIVQYYCDEYADKPVVADWNNLRNGTLEMSTPCGRHGFSGDCSYGLWAFEMNIYTDPQTLEYEPVRYLRKNDDCEWIGSLVKDQLPPTITVWHK